MANFIQRIIDALSFGGESKQIKAMRERAKERDKNDNAHKTQREIELEQHAAASASINNEESRV